MPKFILYIGPHGLDLLPLQGRLMDCEEGGLQGLRTDMQGFEAMRLGLAEAMPIYGAAAGVPQDVYDHFDMCNETVDMIDTQLAIATKQVEVLKESRAYYVDARQNDVALMADAMKSRALRRKDHSILIPFEALLRYHGQIGEKAFATRKKNAQAQAEAEAEAEAPVPTVPIPTQPVEPAPPV